MMTSVLRAIATEIQLNPGTLNQKHSFNTLHLKGIHNGIIGLYFVLSPWMCIIVN